MMIIENRDQPRYRIFGKVQEGEVFRYKGAWYLRVKDIYVESRTIDYYNAISLEDYHPACFDYQDEVYVDENARLIVGESSFGF